MEERQKEIAAVGWYFFQGAVQSHSVISVLNRLHSSGNQEQVPILIALVLNLRNHTSERVVWQWERDQNFFEEMFRNQNIQLLFKQYFRINKETFNKLCNLLRPELEKETTQLRSPVTLEKRVAIAIRRLAKGDSFTSLSMQFGVGSSTCHMICKEFENHLCNIRNNYIKFPNTREKVQRIIDQFEDFCEIPQIVGVIDGSHVTILAPAENKEDYFNRKHA